MGSQVQGFHAAGQNACVGATPLSELAHHFYSVGTRCIDATPQAVCFTYCKPLRIQIGSDYGRSSPLCQSSQYDTDGSLTNYQNCFPSLHLQSLNTFHAGVHRLNKTGLFKRDVIVNANRSALHNPIHNANVLGETTSGRLESRRATNFLIGFTLGKSFMETVIALAAWDVVEDHDSIAGLEITRSIAHSRNLARSLVTENARRRMGSSGNLLQICATNSAGVYPKQQLAGANLGHRHRFQANVVGAPVNGGHHRRGNRSLFFLDGELSGNGHSLGSYFRDWMQPGLGLFHAFRFVHVLLERLAQGARRLPRIRSKTGHSWP